MGILTISNFSSKILIFLLVPLYTSVLTTTEYGSYDLSVSTATLFYPILTCNIVDAVMRFLMDKESDNKKIASIGMKFILISLILFGAGMFFLYATGIWPDIHGLEGFIFLYYTSYVINQFLIQFAKGLEKIKEMGISGVVSTLVTVSANILFLIVFKWGLTGFFIANILAQGMSAIYLGLKIKIIDYIDNLHTDNLLEKEMLAYSIPLIASTIGWWINSTADKYVVAFMIGVSANGLLSVAYKIPQILNTIQGIFIQAWQISAIKEYGEKDTAVFYGNTFAIINLMMCACCSWLIVLTRPISYLLFAKDFYVAWKYVPFLLISSIFNCASGLLGPILSAQKNSKAMMWSALIGASVNIVMNIVLVYFCGIQGATIATVICSYVIYALRKKAIGKAILIDKYWSVLLTWVLLCFQAFVASYVSNYYLEILIMLILLVVNIQTIKKVLLKGKNLLKKK